MPVFFASYPYPTDAPRVAFKAGVINKLQQSGRYGHVVVGVGDRPSDLKAYAENGLHSLIVMDSLGECIEAKGDPKVQIKMLHDAAGSLPARSSKSDHGSPVEIEYFSSTPTSHAWEQIQDRLIAMAKLNLELHGES
jgi:hypothetical protein